MNATVAARVDGGEIRLRTSCEPKIFQAVVALCREIPGRRWDAESREWTAPATAASAARVAQIFRSARFEADDGFKRLLEGAPPPAGSTKRAEDPRPVPVDGPTKPWRHQAQAYWFARERQASLLNCGMGTGKSRVVVDLVCSMPEIDRALVLAPKSVVGVWPRMFAIHGSAPVRVLAPQKGTTKTKAKEIEKALALPGKLVVVLNYEAARTGYAGQKIQGMAREILSRKWDLIVLDESHRIKQASGLTSRFCARLQGNRRLCLTGTPMPHSPVDIFGQFRFLDPAIFGVSFAAFRARYAILVQRDGYQEIIGYRDQDDLARRMDTITFTARTEDVLDLPPFVDVDREFDLSPEEARVYREMERDFVADLKTGQVTAANVLVRLLRLAQITSGALETEDGMIEIVGDSKAKLLEEVIEDCGSEPVAIFCRFHRDLDQIHAVAKKLGLESLELSGRRNDLDGGKWERGQVLAVQEQAGGVGVDLTRGRYCVFWSLSYSLGDYQQARARVHRPGQERNVVYVHLIARGTIDRKVRDALDRKEEVVRFVLDQI